MKEGISTSLILYSITTAANLGLHEAYGASHTMEKSPCTAALQQQASLDVLHFELQLLGQMGF